MSIIYNNQVVAGKYTQQVVADADTVNAGIIKLATEEQVIEGVDNTTAITPFYLAQKQDKISAGDGIVIDNNEISCTVNPDEQTIVRKNNGTMQCIGQLTKSNTLKFDWEGTQAEYNVAYLNGTIQPDWYCYITDDEEFVDYGDIANQSLSNLKAEGEARFTAKANTDLDNLSSVGQGKLDIKADKATTLNKSQITNCLLEVPQNIKVELADGVLTLKAGSKVTVPNGVGVFDEVEITADKSMTAPTTSNLQLAVYYNPASNKLDAIDIKTVYSGTTEAGNNSLWYDTTNNNVRRTSGSGAQFNGQSFPIAIVTQSNGAITSIDQVFNGIGYIGSTVWVDKGVKALLPNGRNEDGSLNNVEINTLKVAIMTSPFANIKDYHMCLMVNGSIALPGNNTYSYDKTNNYAIFSNTKQIACLMATFATDNNNQITSFQPKQPFRAVDYNDKPQISGWGMPSNKWIDLTLGAHDSTYTAPANGYCEFSKKSTASGQYVNINNNSCALFVNQYSSASGQAMAVGCWFKKGDTIRVLYTADGATEWFRFIYAQGEV